MLRALSRQFAEMGSSAAQGWDLLRHKAPGQVTFWLIALVVGIASGTAAVIFRFAINRLH